jgi:uncharacterized protein (DUF58 family)
VKRLSSKAESKENSLRKASIHPASVLLNKFALITAFIVLLLAAWGGQTAVVILMGLGLAAAGISYLWSHFSLRGLKCERQVSEHRLFPGEFLDLKLRLVNRKLLPLPWVQVSDEVPIGFTLDKNLELGTRPGFALISKNSSILWYSAATWKYRLQCPRRGYYPLGPLTITSGDIFGLYPRTITETGNDYILVYPKLYEIGQPIIQSLYPLGESRSEKRIFEDPSRTIGIRDYYPGDSLRRIHWKASLRQGELQVKVFEPSTTLRVSIFLAVDSFQHEGLWNTDELEIGISTAASLANQLLEKKSQVGMYSNSRLADTGQPAYIQPATGSDQLLQILEALAKVVPVVSQPFIDYFHQERQSLMLGTTLIFIFSRVPEDLNGVFQELKEKGYKIVVFQAEESKPDSRLADISYYKVSESDEKSEISIQTME